MKTHTYQIIQNVEANQHELISDLIIHFWRRSRWFYYNNNKLIHEIDHLTEEEVIILKLSLHCNTIFISLPDPEKRYVCRY